MSPSRRIREAGDSALLLELEWAIDPEVNARVIAIATVVREAGIAGVRDVVPTFRSVAVFFDPLVTDVALVAHVLREAQHAGPSQVAECLAEQSRCPSCTAASTGRTSSRWRPGPAFRLQDVIERHASRDYRVYMLGFLPGFAYMGIVDAAIAAPRRRTPRVRVPAGIGRHRRRADRHLPARVARRLAAHRAHAARVFDAGADRRPRCLRQAIASGSCRRRRATSRDRSAAPRRRATGDSAAHASPEPRVAVTVIKPGLLTTIQDVGRWGHQTFGVPVSGPMDEVSHRLANLIVGNPSSAAALEATVLGPELRIETEASMAVTGADLGATLDGRRSR